MDLHSFYQRVQLDLLLHGHQYKVYIEIATAAVLLYAGITDFRIFKIRNYVVLLLLALYVPFAFVALSWFDIVLNVLFALIMFAVLLWFFSKRVLGGGDVKLMTVACLWVGVHCALPFAIILLLLIGVHVAAVKVGWARTKPLTGGNAISYAPSIAGAVIGVMLLGCL
ncbi:MAG: prepilin peptidase [Xanthobacteraceae bacterium]